MTAQVMVSGQVIDLSDKQYQRLLDGFKIGNRDDCWYWQGYVDPVSGYVKFGLGQKYKTSGHRVAYQVLTGILLRSNQTLDHNCHNVAAHAGECPGGPCRHRSCMNPYHMVICSQGDNLKASPYTFVAKNLAVTHCPQGHAYEGNNILPRSRGSGRDCRTCNYERSYRNAKRRKLVYDNG